MQHFHNLQRQIHHPPMHVKPRRPFRLSRKYRFQFPLSIPRTLFQTQRRQRSYRRLVFIRRNVQYAGKAKDGIRVATLFATDDGTDAGIFDHEVGQFGRLGGVNRTGTGQECLEAVKEFFVHVAECEFDRDDFEFVVVRAFLLLFVFLLFVVVLFLVLGRFLFVIPFGLFGGRWFRVFVFFFTIVVVVVIVIITVITIVVTVIITIIRIGRIRIPSQHSFQYQILGFFFGRYGRLIIFGICCVTRIFGSGWENLWAFVFFFFIIRLFLFVAVVVAFLVLGHCYGSSYLEG
mmetsp:Transcript_77574/g.116627  ORF Transcript_77574/g.116627 Transcript_77574/m.116627 type:complete len:290 (-) Transcript_77574:85-954(-)